jgi:hypothetical protein
MKQIGNLFILRININLVGSILDSPVSATAAYVLTSLNLSFAGILLVSDAVLIGVITIKLRC